MRRRRTKIERISDRGDVRRLIRILDRQDWLVDRDGFATDLAVGRRAAAVAALGTIGSPQAEEGVVRALGDGDPRVRLAAVRALRPEPSRHAAQTLARTAASWSDPSLKTARSAALDLLVGVADELLAVVYAQTLANDPAGDALSEQDEDALRRLFPAVGGAEALALAERLAERLAAPDEGRRRRAQHILTILGRTAVEPLVAALNDPHRQMLAGEALGRIRDRRAVPGLLRVLEGDDPPARAMAARTLGDIRDARALEALLHAADDPHADIRDAALDSLDRMRSLIAVLGIPALMRTHQESIEAPEEEARGPAEPPPLPPSNGRDHRPMLRRLLGR
ncbi:MAG: HEAT repeat domain-containing protein [Actinomycetota bacterium]|nr:HEAT repeat domain-containing protein [Actinomycetota bacterium]